MQMFAMDSFYLCAVAVAGAGRSWQGPAAARPPQLVCPSPPARHPHRAQLPDTALTRAACAMMQWDNFYRESAHF